MTDNINGRRQFTIIMRIVSSLLRKEVSKWEKLKCLSLYITVFRLKKPVAVEPELFNPEDGGSGFLRNVGADLPD
jgi:hypothetical protein